MKKKKVFSLKSSNGDNLKHPWFVGSVTLEWGEVYQRLVAVEMSDYSETVHTAQTTGTLAKRLQTLGRELLPVGTDCGHPPLTSFYVCMVQFADTCLPSRFTVALEQYYQVSWNEPSPKPTTLGRPNVQVISTSAKGINSSCFDPFSVGRFVGSNADAQG